MKNLCETVELMQYIEYDDAYTYYFNPIEGTKAYSMPEAISEEIKLKRLEHIIRIQREISMRKKIKKIGKMVKILVEEISKKKDNELLGRTEHDDMVIISGPRKKIGSFITVKLLSLKGNTFLAEEVT